MARRYHQTTKLSTYQWNKKYEDYKFNFYKNLGLTKDPEAELLTKKEFKQEYKDQMNIKADRRARMIAEQQFYQISRPTARKIKATLEEAGAEGYSSTEIRTMQTNEIADLYKEYGVDLDQTYWQLRNQGKSPAEAKKYISVNYFNSI